MPVEQMQKLYGPDAAALHSAMRADKRVDRGNVEGFNMCRRVVAAIN